MTSAPQKLPREQVEKWAAPHWDEADDGPDLHTLQGRTATARDLIAVADAAEAVMNYWNNPPNGIFAHERFDELMLSLRAALPPREGSDADV